ncbi:hypothetical protein MCOR27_005666 [Pyricularia oryzae]|uniref:Uncharacterized protein n=4 Tax=Pyricularia TaxID=48558 RepID=A0ABQ8NYF3_PYRGI|nr:uncharacterized protein MGG_15817 [Pyricularia oryzae 70-15]KAH8839469.1 hypothetical protein MCOR01_008668 [Pyricularia oryzae]KAI6303933.1 hypothetical protein MCOR33_000917 [Pyricularia grisea]EHA55258.1 hypothetical protein MGG_15817 [Pyricularia oryzae 70-15]KAH9439322.1 hypothetical protein MCOR02_002884 [Pyricularia oryzae]KAI6256864.1 hypothetical protein MCOR19_006683 [Pyricularia oryzae]
MAPLHSETHQLYRRDASSPAEVPLWAFIIMTLWALALMVFIGFIFWRPAFLLRELNLRPQEDKSDEWRYLEPLNDPDRRQSRIRRVFSMRSNINRWRNGVQPGRQSIAMSIQEGEPSDYNYAPASARPVSQMQRITEDEQINYSGKTQESAPPTTQKKESDKKNDGPPLEETPKLPSSSGQA